MSRRKSNFGEYSEGDGSLPLRLGKAGFAKLGAVVVAVVLVSFLAVPVVPYSASFNIPNNTVGTPDAVCNYILQAEENNNVITVNATIGKEYQDCLQENAYPPTVLTGASTLSYSLFGVGSPPFPSYALAIQGDESLLVTFQGSSVAYVEGPFGGGTRLNPSDLISVDDLAILQGNAGTMNFTAIIHNISNESIFIYQAFFDYPGLGTNQTLGGLNWHTSEFSGNSFPCLGVVSAISIPPGGTCVVHEMSGPDGSLVPGKSYPLRLVVNGFVASDEPVTEATTTTSTTTSSSLTLVQGNYFPSGGFVSVFTKQVAYPGSVPDAEWVDEFVAQVNSHRQTPLIESSNLDAFAQQRFKTASSQPDIADYNFTQDADSWFGAGGGGVTEVLLYPTYLSPDSYASFLQSSAPAHWTALTNLNAAEFGYYIGQAPYYEVSVGCPVYEVQGGVNVTQYFESHGCTVTPVPDTTWLVVVLAP